MIHGSRELRSVGGSGWSWVGGVGGGFGVTCREDEPQDEDDEAFRIRQRPRISLKTRASAIVSLLPCRGCSSWHEKAHDEMH